MMKFVFLPPEVRVSSQEDLGVWGQGDIHLVDSTAVGQDEGSLGKKWCWRWGNTTRWQQRARSKFIRASSFPASPSARPSLAVGTAFTALLRCLNLCSLNFWMENYASHAVGMQMCGDKIHGLKQIVDRMQINTGQSGPGLEVGLDEGLGGQELIWIPSPDSSLLIILEWDVSKPRLALTLVFSCHFNSSSLLFNSIRPVSPEGCLSAMWKENIHNLIVSGQRKGKVKV